MVLEAVLVKELHLATRAIRVLSKATFHGICRFHGPIRALYESSQSLILKRLLVLDPISENFDPDLLLSLQLHIVRHHLFPIGNVVGCSRKVLMSIHAGRSERLRSRHIHALRLTVRISISPQHLDVEGTTLSRYTHLSLLLTRAVVHRNHVAIFLICGVYFYKASGRRRFVNLNIVGITGW